MTTTVDTSPDASPTDTPTATIQTADEISSAARHPGDLIRVGLGLLALFVSLLGVQRDQLTVFERDLFRLVNDLPSALSTLLGPVMQLGNVFAAPTVALLVLVVNRRRWRASVDVVAAGVLAWFAAKGVKSLVERPRPGGLVDDVSRIASLDGLGFVSGHTAVAAAIVTGVSPYVSRRTARALWILPWTVGAARIYYGAHLPLDIVGGVAVGWAVGAIVHLALGAPHRAPGLAEAAAVLQRAGIRASDLERVPGTPQGSFPFVASIDGTRRFVKLLDPERRDRDAVYRVARFLSFRDVRDEVTAEEPSSQAHREAAMTLIARSHQVRVPAVLGIASDRGRVWVVQEHIAAPSLDRIDLHRVTDRVLDDAWRELAGLRSAGIAHRDLVADNILIDDEDQVWFVDFAHAKTSTRGRALDDDVAELLVTTALVVGSARAVDAAERILGAGPLARAVPALQPLVMTATTRARLRRAPALLDELRDEVSGRVHPGGAPPAIPGSDGSRRWHRLAAFASPIGVAAALVGIAGPSEVLDVAGAPGYRWIGVASLAVAVGVIAGAAVLLAGIDRRLAIGRTALATLEDRSVEALEAPRRRHATLAAHLRSAGLPKAESWDAVRRWYLVRISFLIIGLVAAAVSAIADRAAFELPDEATGLIGIAAAAVGIEVALSVARRSAGVGSSRDLGRTPSAANSPMLVVAGLLQALVSIGATVCLLEAFGGGGLVAGGALVAAVALLVTFLVPLSDASGVTTVLLAFGFAASGAPVAAAVVAALGARLLQGWVPIASGVVVRRVSRT